VASDDFGQDASEIVGEGWRAFIHPDDLPDCLQAWEIALKTGNEYVVEFRLLFKDGSYKWHLGRALPFLEDGEIKLWIGTNTNIDLQKTNEQRKDEFLSIASHELKTPLTSLKASIQIIQKIVKTDLTSEKLPLFMDKASNNLNKMLYLMEDLMNVSKIQQGQLALNKTRINLVDLVNDCCEHIRMGAAHELILMGDKELFIDADYRRIDQVVVNLINNAVKYSPLANRVEITVEHDADHAKISVRDFGIGVSPEKLPHLFDRYFRVDSSGVQFSGLGLGLYISAEIVKRHNGEIGVESVVDEGSTFWFSLPMD
jgi:PAS domain S-box-containing protein